MRIDESIIYVAVRARTQAHHIFILNSEFLVMKVLRKKTPFTYYYFYQSHQLPSILNSQVELKMCFQTNYSLKIHFYNIWYFLFFKKSGGEKLFLVYLALLYALE